MKENVSDWNREAKRGGGGLELFCSSKLSKICLCIIVLVCFIIDW